MSGKSAAWRERRLRYRRLRRNEKAVSPVVATLILILIAVAAAAGLYLWLTGWQGGVTKSIGTPIIPSNLKFSIGGSTTVYPLSQLAIKWFEQNNTNTNITNQQGGSVAGAEAYCAGQVDVGQTSSSFTQGQLSGDGCSAALAANTVQTVVGVDAIVGIADTHNTIFGTGSTNTTVSSAQFSFNASVMLGIYVADSSTNVSQNQPGGLNSYVFPAALCGARANTIGASPQYAACPVAIYNHPFPWSDIPFPAGCVGITAGKLNFSACHFGTANTNPIKAYDRGDSSGTEQGFVQKYLLNGANLAKDGSGNSCGTDNQLVSCGVTVNHAVGNPALAAAVAGDVNGLGFNSFGQATAQAGLYLAGYMGGSNTAPVTPKVADVLGAYKGTVAPSAAYGPWRVLEYLTNGVPPTGSIEAQYINFVLGPEVNLALGQATGYISLYAA